METLGETPSIEKPKRKMTEAQLANLQKGRDVRKQRGEEQRAKEAELLKQQVSEEEKKLLKKVKSKAKQIALPKVEVSEEEEEEVIVVEKRKRPKRVVIVEEEEPEIQLPPAPKNEMRRLKRV